MASKLALNLSFQRPECRTEYERARQGVRARLAEEGVEEGALRVLELGAALDVGVARLKRDLLASALCWNEENQAITAWIHQQHRKVSEMGQKVLESIEGTRQGRPMMTRVIALTLHHWAEALKWIAGRERHDYQPLHAMLRLATAEGRQRETVTWVVDGRGHTLCVESLYFRALLLDRFGSGTLTRQQVEVLDAWLLEWSDCLAGFAQPREGATLRVDLDANAGLREGPRDSEGPTLYLPLAALEARRRDVVRELHLGRIFPAHGCTAEFRIEEHVTVLDHLQRALRAPDRTRVTRAERQQEPGTRVEVWVGLADILARGAGVRVGTETGRWRALSLTDPSISTDLKDMGRSVRYDEADPSRRYLWLADTSATGRGFEALEVDAVGLEIGDLVGWRPTSGAPIALGHVIRRLPSTTAGQVFIGVRLLTELGLPFTLSRLDAFDRGNADSTFLFVPGDDECGRRDAFLISEATYQQQHTFVARVGDDAFTLRMNRVRAKGRGWLLAGFEIVPSRRVAAPVSADEAPRFELVLDEPEDDMVDPWAAEVNPRQMG
ncbi:MAG TPA: hypothetical protein VM122_12210 [Usitatibacter sp.]|nr:hypothetical protein [Usitatibacter sp.]